MMVEEAMPFYKLWVKIEKEYTSGDGYLDKLCMELVGLPSSRCRPPTRDVRERYREDTLPDDETEDGVPRLDRAIATMTGLANMIVLDENDNVGVALRDIAASEQASDAHGPQIAGDRADAAGPQDRACAISPKAKPSSAWAFLSASPPPAIEGGHLVHVHNVRSQYLDNDEDHYE